MHRDLAILKLFTTKQLSELTFGEGASQARHHTTNTLACHCFYYSPAGESICDGICKLSMDYGLFFTH